MRGAAPPSRPRDLVLMDPPYATGLAAMTIGLLCNPAWVADGGFVAIESAGEPFEIPQAFTLVSERRFGKAHMLLLRRGS